MNAASRVAVVYNPVKIDESDLRGAVRARARRHGWTDVTLHATTVDEPGTAAARQAVERGVGLVVAVGGDGTVRSVATGLEGSGTPMGIVPRGTGNLLARNLSLPLDDVDRALAVAMGGRTRTVDMGHVEYVDAAGRQHDEVFLVMLGAGMDADMIAGTDDRLKARVGWMAYVGAFARSVLSGHRIEVEYTVDDGAPLFSHTRSLLVANCGTLQGGMVLLPDAAIDDGLLDVLALRPKGVFKWLQTSYVVVVEHTFLRRFGRGRRGPGRRLRRRDPTRPLDFQQGTEVRVSVLEKPAPFQIDGEDIGTVGGFTARIRPRRLGVRVRP